MQLQNCLSRIGNFFRVLALHANENARTDGSSMTFEIICASALKAVRTRFPNMKSFLISGWVLLAGED